MISLQLSLLLIFLTPFLSSSSPLNCPNYNSTSNSLSLLVFRFEQDYLLVHQAIKNQITGQFFRHIETDPPCTLYNFHIDLDNRDIFWLEKTTRDGQNITSPLRASFTHNQQLKRYNYTYWDITGETEFVTEDNYILFGIFPDVVAIYRCQSIEVDEVPLNEAVVLMYLTNVKLELDVSPWMTSVLGKAEEFLGESKFKKEEFHTLFERSKCSAVPVSQPMNTSYPKPSMTTTEVPKNVTELQESIERGNYSSPSPIFIILSAVLFWILFINVFKKWICESHSGGDNAVRPFNADN